MAQIKENFCAVCIAPVALAVSSAIGVGSALSDDEKNKQRTRIIMWSFIISTLIMLLWIWFKYIKPCKSCKL